MSPPPVFQVEGETLRTLPDLVVAGLRVLFVGFNPSLRAARVGHYYAGPGNQFWRMLELSGLTPRRYGYVEDATLPEIGIGITDLVKRPTRTAAEVTAEEYRAGVGRLRGILAEYRPRVTCYNGMGVYLRVAARRKAEWGMQAESVVAGVRDFVAPNPSGLARIPLAEKALRYAELRAGLNHV